MSGERARTPSSPPVAMGKYTPFARLGNGGMADVYLAAARGPVGFNKLVVIKRMRDSEEPAFLKMFLDEARLTARLNHPNVVHIYEVGEANGVYFIAMEYLDGQSLDSISRALDASSRQMSEAFATYIIAHALKGLHYAHQMTDYDGSPLGIVHRDCSPQNLFVTYTGQVKVLDFGIAKAASNQTHTEAGILKGKVRYMAPEQMMGGLVDRRADVFSMGVVLWQLLAGCRLFTGDTYEVIQKLIREDAPSVRSVRPDVSQTLDGIVAKALQRDPKQRYASAEAMQNDLEQFLRAQELVDDGDIGAFVGELFVERRVEVRERIQKYLAVVQTQDVDSAEGGAFSTETGTLPRLIPIEGTPSAERMPALSDLVTIAPPKRSRVKLVAAGAAALLLVAGAGKLSQRAPAANAQAPIAASSSAVVDVLRASITSSPPGALIEWNGRPLDRTPAVVELTGKAQTVVLTLEGYFPESLVIHPMTDGGLPAYQIALRARTPAASAAQVPAPAPARPDTAARRTFPQAPRDLRSKTAAPSPSAVAPAAAPLRPIVRVIEDIPVIDEVQH